ncbi:MAG: hypothetical protein WDO17_02850 [Alphaproteobacteria bacterium]
MRALAERAEAILRDLELPALRSRYRFYQTLGFGRNLPCFYSEPYERGSSQADAKLLYREARELNKHPRIIVRLVELALDGIRPRMVCDVSYGDSSQLVLLVEFGERGRRVIEGSRIGLSEISRLTRKFLWIGYYLIAIGLLLFVFADRIGRVGWLPTLVGLALVVALVIFTRRMWR